VPVDGALQPLHFAGARLEPGYLVVAACSRHGLGHLNEELMRINNEQTNVLRSRARSCPASWNNGPSAMTPSMRS